MTMEKVKRKAKTKNDATLTFVAEFKPSLLSRVFAILGMLIALALFLFFMIAIHAGREDPDVWLAWICMVPVLVTGTTYTLWRSLVVYFQTTLTVYEEGIALREGASRVSTKWDNIRYFSPNHGLLLHKPAGRQRDGMAERLFFERSSKIFYSNLWASALSAGFISSMILPIGNRGSRRESINEKKFWESEFGQLVREYAPHVKTIQQPTDEMLYILKPKQDETAEKQK